MKIDGYKMPKSSFLSVEKDTGIMMNSILKNERLKRLLYYTDRNALDKKNLTEDQTFELIEHNIKLVPKVYIDGTVLNYLIITFNDFVDSENPEFRDNTIEFDVICHYDQWLLKDFALRPFKIAAEIDSMFNKAKLSGIGRLEFQNGSLIILTNEFSGVCLKYTAVHGGEDKKFMPNPIDEPRFLQDFKDYINN